ncbi:hypothetical protein C8J57DRAFT_1712569 [Mycena rebaudengoi]|nr:hypothetical protein C8J57DRAFT_1712569 [Mycena rebaudengoi]
MASISACALRSILLPSLSPLPVLPFFLLLSPSPLPSPLSSIPPFQLRSSSILPQSLHAITPIISISSSLPPFPPPPPSSPPVPFIFIPFAASHPASLSSSPSLSHPYSLLLRCPPS